MDASTNAPIQAANVRTEWVRYEGTDILRQGEAVCYNSDYGTATVFDGRRHNHVERPSTANNMAFAGVAARDYSAKASGQFIEIYTPGSKGVLVALGVDTVLNTGVLAFTVGSGSAAGRWVAGKEKGRGAAKPKQTITALIEDGKTGTWSLATNGVTLTVTATAGLVAGDTVVLLSSEAEDATKKVAPGKYTIASVTDATTLVLSASAVVATPVAALTCTGYAYSGNPKCQADLQEGNEAGGAEFITAVNAGVVGLPYMVGGITYLCATDIAADADVTFAQGALPGDLKTFICLGTVGTSDYTVDLATNGIQIDGSTALAEVNAFDAAADAAYFVFKGARWFCLDLAGSAAQA
jgi:hypothetical protein